jgi:hypothetical protein
MSHCASYSFRFASRCVLVVEHPNGPGILAWPKERGLQAAETSLIPETPRSSQSPNSCRTFLQPEGRAPIAAIESRDLETISIQVSGVDEHEFLGIRFDDLWHRDAAPKTAIALRITLFLGLVPKAISQSLCRKPLSK